MYYVPHIILNMKKVLENMNKLLYAISDLHIGDGSEADDFKHNLTAFNEFLDKTNNDCASLILIGDIYELWQYKFEDIYKAYRDTIDNMNKLTALYIIGNHDQIVPTFLTMPNIRTRFLSQSCLFLHGNEYDSWNTWGTRRGQRITKAWGYVERLFPNANNIAEHLWRSSNGNYLSQIRTDAIEVGASTVIFGHTHIRGVAKYKETTIINAGSWVGDDLNYVSFQNGECELINWRS